MWGRLTIQTGGDVRQLSDSTAACVGRQDVASSPRKVLHAVICAAARPALAAQHGAALRSERRSAGSAGPSSARLERAGGGCRSSGAPPAASQLPAWLPPARADLRRSTPPRRPASAATPPIPFASPCPWIAPVWSLRCMAHAGRERGLLARRRYSPDGLEPPDPVCGNPRMLSVEGSEFADLSRTSLDAPKAANSQFWTKPMKMGRAAHAGNG